MSDTAAVNETPENAAAAPKKKRRRRNAFSAATNNLAVGTYEDGVVEILGQGFETTREAREWLTENAENEVGLNEDGSVAKELVFIRLSTPFKMTVKRRVTTASFQSVKLDDSDDDDMDDLDDTADAEDSDGDDE